MINFAELNKELEKKEYIEKLYQVFGIYFVYWTQMTWNKRKKPFRKQYQTDFTPNRKQRGLLFYVMCVRYTQ